MRHLQELGADEVVDYTKQTVDQVFKNNPFDAVIDQIGGEVHQHCCCLFHVAACTVLEKEKVRPLGVIQDKLMVNPSFLPFAQANVQGTEGGDRGLHCAAQSFVNTLALLTHAWLSLAHLLPELVTCEPMPGVRGSGPCMPSPCLPDPDMTHPCCSDLHCTAQPLPIWHYMISHYMMLQSRTL